MSDLPPRLIVVGGPNGAGKSTFVREALESKDLLYLCADEAAFELCPEHPESVAAAAGRLFSSESARREMLGSMRSSRALCPGRVFVGR